MCFTQQMSPIPIDLQDPVNSQHHQRGGILNRKIVLYHPESKVKYSGHYHYQQYHNWQSRKEISGNDQQQGRDSLGREISWFRCTSIELFRTATSKTRMALMIAISAGRHHNKESVQAVLFKEVELFVDCVRVFKPIDFVQSPKVLVFLNKNLASSHFVYFYWPFLTKTQ